MAHIADITGTAASGARVYSMPSALSMYRKADMSSGSVWVEIKRWLTWFIGTRDLDSKSTTNWRIMQVNSIDYWVNQPI